MRSQCSEDVVCHGEGAVITPAVDGDVGLSVDLRSAPVEIRERRTWIGHLQ